MSTSLHGFLTGTFTSDGTAFNLSIPSGYNAIELINLTDCATPDNGVTTQVMRARGYSLLPAGCAYVTAKTTNQIYTSLETVTATNGFTFLADSGTQTPGAAVALTGVSTANPAVVTSASTAVIGDIVRVYNLTGVAGNMYQISGMDFSVTAVNAGVTQTLGYLNSAGFADAATGGSIRVISSDARFYPRRRYITAITAANPAVVTMSVTHGFVAGEKVRMIVPPQFGMTQMNNLLATITAVNTGTNTITLDIDSSAFTAFAFPTSAVAALGMTFAEVVPVGEAAVSPYQNLLSDATLNTSISGVKIGTGVQTTGKTYQWIATKGQSI